MLTDVLEQTYTVRTVGSAADAQAQIERREPALMLTELDLPDIDGRLLIADIRERSSVPIIVCTNRRGQGDRVIALRMGADDVMSKPVDRKELVERVAAVLRRVANARKRRTITAGELTIELSLNIVSYRGRSVNLTRIEYHLLRALASRYGEVLSGAALVNTVWGYEDTGVEAARTLYTHMGRMRQKLESIGAGGALQTVRNKGYMLLADESEGGS